MPVQEFPQHLAGQRDVSTKERRDITEACTQCLHNPLFLKGNGFGHRIEQSHISHESFLLGLFSVKRLHHFVCPLAVRDGFNQMMQPSFTTTGGRSSQRLFFPLEWSRLSLPICKMEERRRNVS